MDLLIVISELSPQMDLLIIITEVSPQMDLLIMISEVSPQMDLLIIISEVSPQMDLFIIISEVSPQMDLLIIISEVSPQMDLLIIISEVSPQMDLLIIISDVSPQMDLLISSPEPKAHKVSLYYSSRTASVCASVSAFSFSNIFSETAWLMKAKFCVEHPWVGGTKVCSRDLDHQTKMAATPIYGKNHSKIFFSRTSRQISTKLGM